MSHHSPASQGSAQGSTYSGILAHSSSASVESTCWCMPAHVCVSQGDAAWVKGAHLISQPGPCPVILPPWAGSNAPHLATSPNDAHAGLGPLYIHERPRKHSQGGVGERPAISSAQSGSGAQCDQSLPRFVSACRYISSVVESSCFCLTGSAHVRCKAAPSQQATGLSPHIDKRICQSRKPPQGKTDTWYVVSQAAFCLGVLAVDATVVKPAILLQAQLLVVSRPVFRHHHP
jgi:hypothetical protein